MVDICASRLSWTEVNSLKWLRRGGDWARMSRLRGGLGAGAEGEEAGQEEGH